MWCQWQAGSVLRAGRVPSKHIAPPVPEEGENSQRCCSPTPFVSLLAWCPAERCLCSPFPKHPSTPGNISLWEMERRVSQRRGWQLEAYMPLRGCGVRSTQAGGEMAGEGSTEEFWCWQVPQVQGRWAKPCWRGCYLAACVASGLWSGHGAADGAWRRAASLSSASSTQVRAWQGGWGPSALISIEVFPGPLRNAIHF